MLKILFSGCSITHGDGLDLKNQNSMHYSNVLVSEVFDAQAHVNNIGVGGYSNLKIFLDTCIELTKSTQKYDFVFVGWTSYPRFYAQVGLEQYNCNRSFIPGSSLLDFYGNNLSFSSKFLNNLRDSLSLISNPHYDILDIVQYVNILKLLAESKGTKIYFLNNLCQWDANYFNQIESPIKPDLLTNYTNKILNSNNRDDNQIDFLYRKMHKDYQSVGGIQKQLWLNLYDSMISMIIDLGTDNLHPGPLTHQSYGNFLAKKLRNLSS